MKSELRYRGTLQAEYAQQAWFARDSRNLTAITLVAATANYRAANGPAGPGSGIAQVHTTLVTEPPLFAMLFSGSPITKTVIEI